MAVTTERETRTADGRRSVARPTAGAEVPAEGPTVTQGLDQSHGSFELVVSPLVMGLLGWWLDGRVGTGPWLAIVLAVVGVAGAAIKVYFGYRVRMDAVAEDARSAAEERAAANRARVAEREQRRAALDAELAANLEAATARDIDRVDRLEVAASDGAGPR